MKHSNVKLKKALKKADEDAKKLTLSESNLKESFEATLMSKKKLEDNLSAYKDEHMDTSD